MDELHGRVGIVTGGSSGIGFAIANALADRGARVYSVSRSGGPKTGLPAGADGVVHVQADATDYSGIAALFEKIADSGPLDFLVNNAGRTMKARAEEFPAEEFSAILELNVTSPFRLSQLAFPYLTRSVHKGRIITISSMAAHLGFSEVVPYSVSKAAVLGLTRGLAVEWAQDNICVNSIAPGWFPSEMSKQVMTQERTTAILARMPIHAFGNTKDIGAMAAFLIGDAATYITGQDFAVDGGALAYGF